MGRPRDYSSPQHQGRKVPQVHRLGFFVMLTLYPKISCLLHGQTQALPWELSGSRHSTVHLNTPPNQHTYTCRQPPCQIPCTINIFWVEKGWDMWSVEYVSPHKRHRNIAFICTVCSYRAKKAHAQNFLGLYIFYNFWKKKQKLTNFQIFVPCRGKTLKLFFKK